MQVSGMLTCSILWAQDDPGCCDSPERPYPETGWCHTGSHRVTAELGSLSHGMWHPGDPARPLPPAKSIRIAAGTQRRSTEAGSPRTPHRAPAAMRCARCGTAAAGGAPGYISRHVVAAPPFRRPAPAHARGKLPPAPRPRHRAGQPRSPPPPLRSPGTAPGGPALPLLRESNRCGTAPHPAAAIPTPGPLPVPITVPPPRSAPPPPPAPRLPPARPPPPAPQQPERRAGTTPRSHRGSPAATGPNQATDAGGARPYRAHAAARPFPPHRVGPRRRRRAAPGQQPVPIPVNARPSAQCHRRCCRVNESLEVGGGWHRLSPPPPRSASRRLRAPQRFAPVPAPGAAGALGTHKHECTPMHNNAHTCRSMHTRAHAAHRLVGPTQAHARKRGHVWATQAQASSDGACTHMHLFTPSSSTAQHGTQAMLHTVCTCMDPTLPGHGTMMAPGNGCGAGRDVCKQRDRGTDVCAHTCVHVSPL